MDTSHVEAEASAPPKDKKDDPAYRHTDDNVGVLRKSNTVTYIAHKVALVVDANEDFCYTHYTFKWDTPDPATLEKTLRKFKEEFPGVAAKVNIVLADGIFQSANNQQVTKEVLKNAKLYAPINPHNHKSVKVENVRGITEIDPYGRPQCLSGHHLVLLGRDQKNQQFIWGCPVFSVKGQEDELACSEVNHLQCCNLNPGGRYYRTNRVDFPQIDWEVPQHLARFGLRYRKRSSVERVIGNYKEGYGFRRVHKQNVINVDAHTERCILASHILAYMAFAMGKPKLKRSWNTLVA